MKKTPLPEGMDLEVLYSEEQIRTRVRELGERISADYAGRLPVLVAILKGSVVFLSDLIRSITVPVHIDFMAITGFESAGKAGGVVRILKDLDIPVSGRPVVIVEDIIDTGLTAGYLVKNLRARDPESLEICSLLDRGSATGLTTASSTATFPTSPSFRRRSSKTKPPRRPSLDSGIPTVYKK
jgi:hypoxanthine phosphoribosyltransferase